MKLPQAQNTLVAAIDQALEARQDRSFRDHLGASVLGHDCARWLWLAFHWAVREDHPGRVLRLFRRGLMEEAIVVADLRAAGLDVRNTGPDQITLRIVGHVGGSMDGIVESGVPEAPKTRHVLEIKTHSRKSFDSLEKGVYEAHRRHWVQMQAYMHASKIDRALYVAVCKDDDRLYVERVHYDREEAIKAIDRGHRISLAPEPPPKISNDPSWWQCKLCAAHAMCHKGQPTQEVNCRTCAHSTAKEDGTWRCERHDADDIPPDWQRNGCESHALHPSLVPWEMIESRDKWTPIYVIDGKQVANGEGDAHVFTSREILSGITSNESLQRVKE